MYDGRTAVALGLADGFGSTQAIVRERCKGGAAPENYFQSLRIASAKCMPKGLCIEVKHGGILSQQVIRLGSTSKLSKPPPSINPSPIKTTTITEHKKRYGKYAEIRRFVLVRRPFGRNLVLQASATADSPPAQALVLLAAAAAAAETALGATGGGAGAWTGGLGESREPEAAEAASPKGGLPWPLVAAAAVVSAFSTPTFGPLGLGGGERLPEDGQTLTASSPAAGALSLGGDLPQFSYPTDSLPAFAMPGFELSGGLGGGSSGAVGQAPLFKKGGHSPLARLLGLFGKSPF